MLKIKIIVNFKESTAAVLNFMLRKERAGPVIEALLDL
jgi:hypothetical protein